MSDDTIDSLFMLAPAVLLVVFFAIWGIRTLLRERQARAKECPRCRRPRTGVFCSRCGYQFEKVVVNVYDGMTLDLREYKGTIDTLNMKGGRVVFDSGQRTVRTLNTYVSVDHATFHTDRNWTVGSKPIE